jgi:hypothetical protein
VRVVQLVNGTTSLSCPFPPHWDTCTFTKDPGHGRLEVLCLHLQPNVTPPPGPVLHRKQ